MTNYESNKPELRWKPVLDKQEYSKWEYSVLQLNP